MATAPWWWVPLITVIGAPLLGALLYFSVPLLRVAKRLGIWLSASNPPWWVQNIFAALLVGGIVAAVSVLWQNSLSDAAAKQATRLENLRFVRQLSSESNVVSRPFAALDLQSQDLSGLDLRGADLSDAKLQHAKLIFAHLSTTPPRFTLLVGADLTGADLSRAELDNADLVDADLTGANLENAILTGATMSRADLSGADLDGADLTGAFLRGVHYDEKTAWPTGFKAPQCGHQTLFCVLGRKS
jgi:uncharacterized protein YjbI with pentapeptide repeats